MFLLPISFVGFSGFRLHSQIVYVRDNNYEDHVVHYDKNGFLVIPAQIGATADNYYVITLGLMATVISAALT